MNTKPYPKLHTHWSFAPANTRPKMPKEYTIATTPKTENKEVRWVTKYIIYGGKVLEKSIVTINWHLFWKRNN